MGVKRSDHASEIIAKLEEMKRQADNAQKGTNESIRKIKASSIKLSGTFKNLRESLNKQVQMLTSEINGKRFNVKIDFSNIDVNSEDIKRKISSIISSFKENDIIEFDAKGSEKQFENLISLYVKYEEKLKTLQTQKAFGSNKEAIENMKEQIALASKMKEIFSFLNNSTDAAIPRMMGRRQLDSIINSATESLERFNAVKEEASKTKVNVGDFGNIEETLNDLKSTIEGIKTALEPISEIFKNEGAAMQNMAQNGTSSFNTLSEAVNALYNNLLNVEREVDNISKKDFNITHVSQTIQKGDDSKSQAKLSLYQQKATELLKVVERLNNEQTQVGNVNNKVWQNAINQFGGISSFMTKVEKFDLTSLTGKISGATTLSAIKNLIGQITLYKDTFLSVVNEINNVAPNTIDTSFLSGLDDIDKQIEELEKTKVITDEVKESSDTAAKSMASSDLSSSIEQLTKIGDALTEIKNIIEPLSKAFTTEGTLFNQMATSGALSMDTLIEKLQEALKLSAQLASENVHVVPTTVESKKQNAYIVEDSGQVGFDFNSVGEIQETKDSTAAINKEGEALIGVGEAAEAAAAKKNKFAEANREVADSGNKTAEAVAQAADAVKAEGDAAKQAAQSVAETSKQLDRVTNTFMGNEDEPVKKVKQWSEATKKAYRTTKETLFRNDDGGFDVISTDVTDNFEKMRQAAEKAEQAALKAVKAQDSYISQKNKNISALSSALDPNANRTLIGTDYEEEARKKIEAIQGELSKLDAKLEDGSRVIFSEEELNAEKKKIEELIRTAGEYIRTSRNAEYAPIAFDSQSVSGNVRERQNTLSLFINNLRQAGVLTGELKADTDRLSDALNAVKTNGDLKNYLYQLKEVQSKSKLIIQQKKEEDAMWAEYNKGRTDEDIQRQTEAAWAEYARQNAAAAKEEAAAERELAQARKEADAYYQQQETESKKQESLTLDIERQITLIGKQEAQWKKNGQLTDEVHQKVEDLSNALLKVSNSSELAAWRKQWMMLKDEVMTTKYEIESIQKAQSKSEISSQKYWDSAFKDSLAGLVTPEKRPELEQLKAYMLQQADQTKEAVVERYDAIMTIISNKNATMQKLMSAKGENEKSYWQDQYSSWFGAWEALDKESTKAFFEDSGNAALIGAKGIKAFNNQLELSNVLSGKQKDTQINELYDLYKKQAESVAKQDKYTSQLGSSFIGEQQKKLIQERLNAEKETEKKIQEQIEKYGELYKEADRLAVIEEKRKETARQIQEEAAKQADKEAERARKQAENYGKSTYNSATRKYDNTVASFENLDDGVASKSLLDAMDDYKRKYDELTAARQRFIDNPALANDQSEKNAFNGVAQSVETARKKVQLYIDDMQKLKQVEDEGLLKGKTKQFDPNGADSQTDAIKKYAAAIYDGKLQVTGWNAAGNEMYGTLDRGKGVIEKVTVALDRGTNTLYSYGKGTKEVGTLWQQLTSDIGKKAKEISAFLIGGGSIYKAIAEVRKGIQYVKEIDSALTELKKVTDETDKAYAQFLQTMSKTGTEVGATVSDLINMAANWARLGYSMQEAGNLAKSTAVLLNVSEFTNAEDASEALISTIQAYGYAAEDSMHVVDVLNEIGNNFAVSSDGLATALQDSASALMSAGNNLEQSVAMVAAANKVLQDPGQVGSALRTISLRIRGTSVKVLEEMGEETDGVVESASKLQAKLKGLTGVNILNDAGGYKDTYTIIKEIAEVWPELNDINKAATLELLAGKNRSNAMAAMLTNLDDLTAAYEDALSAEGSAIAENEKYLDSIQGRIDQFTNSLQTMWMNTISSDTVKLIVSAGTALIKIVDTLGLMPSAFGAIGIAVYLKSLSGLKEELSSVNSESENLLHIFGKKTEATQADTAANIENAASEQASANSSKSEAAAEGISAGAKNADTGATTANTFATRANIAATKALIVVKNIAKGILIGAAISVTTAAIGKLVSGITDVGKEAKKTASEITSAYDTAQKSLKSNKSTIDEISKDYEKLSAGVDKFGNNVSLTTDEYKKYNEIVNKIADMFPNMVQGYTAEGNAILSVKGNVEELTAAYEAAAQAARQAAIAGSGVVFEEFKKNYDSNPATMFGTVGIKQQSTIVDYVRDLLENGTNEAIEKFYDESRRGNTNINGVNYSWAAIKKTLEEAGVTIPTNGLGSLDVEDFKKQLPNLLSFMKSTATKVNTETNKIKSIMSAYLGEDEDYSNLTKEAQSVVARIVSSLDAEFINGFDDAASLYNWIATNIVQPFSNNSGNVQNAIDSFLKIDTSKISVKEYKDSIDEFKRVLSESGISEEAQNQILSAFDIDEESMKKNIDPLITKTKSMLKDEFKDDADSLTISDLKIIDSSAFSDIKAGTLTFDQLKQKIKEVKAEINTGSDGKTFSSYADTLEKFSSIQGISNELIYDNIQLTKEQGEELQTLIGSEAEYAEAVDTSNGYVVKNAKLVKDLIAKKKIEAAQNVKIEKTQARLKYYDLYKQIKKLSGANGELAAKNKDQINTLYAEMGIVQQTISKYSMLEQKLLGAADAYDKFEEAQTADSESDYSSKMTDMLTGLINGLQTGKVGTEAFKAAVKGLIPEEELDKLDTVKDKVKAIADYITTSNFKDYFNFEFDDDGALKDITMNMDNLKAFVEDGFENGALIQTGEDWTQFELSDQIKTLDDLAKAYGMTKEAAFAYLQFVNQYDGEWLIGDFATTFDSLIPTSENIKLFGEEMQKAFDQTKIDLKVRPQVSWEEMKNAGWDTEEGSYSTVNTVTYLASDFGLADKYSSEDYAINVTPILPDGTVIKGGENGLWEYINGKIQNGESVEDLNIFLGKYGDIQTAENEAIKLHQMQEQYYNMVSDYSLDDDIMTTTRQITELNVALANGEISQEQYLAQMYGIGDAATKAQIKTGGLNAKLQEQGETARENAQKWKEASDNYENAKNKVADLESQIKDADGTKLTSLQGQLENAVALVAKYGREVAKYEQTEYTIKFAVDDVQKDIDEIEASYSNFADSVEFDNESGKFIMKSGIDLPQDQVDKFNEYLALLNEKYTLEVMQGEEMPTVLDVLSQIKEILEKAYTLTVDTGDAFDKTSTFKDLWDNIKDKSVTLTTIDYIIKKFGQSGDQEFSGTANVSGSAYASGNWGIKQSEHDSLVGELGEETIVDPRTGRYYTVGTNGAELVDIPKGAIIFNHKQTEELFKNGHINSRGKAYAQGNAHITAVPDVTIKSSYSGAGSYWSDFAKSIDAISDSVDDASSDSKDDFEELFDWFEVLITEIDNKISLIEAKIENTTSASGKNALYQQVVDLNYAKMAALNKGIELYSGKAQKFLNNIPQAYKEMAQNGAVALTDFQGEANEKVVEAIKNYREMKDKVADLNVELENVKKNISDINVQMLETISTEYENKIGLITNLNDRIQKAMDLQEESGERLSANYYNEMIKNAQEALKLQKQQRQEMQAQLDQSVASGDVERYSENWYKMVNDINAVDEAIVQSEIDIESFQNAINDLHWENFERLIKSIENVSDEAEHLRNLIKDDDLTDDVGNWTEAGITALGLASQEMENAKYRAELYGKEIEQLKKDYKAGLYSQDEYNDKLQELKSSQWDCIDAYESAKDAIVDLNKTRIEAVKDGIQKEIDAYEKLIDKRKEDLDAQKDQHDWAKTVKEHTSEIDSIQRQIDALNGDTSASAAAQRKKLQEELTNAQQELEETYYDREIEMQQKALDETLELYKEDKEKKMEELDEYLKHEEQVIADSYELVLSNSEVVYTKLNEMAKEYNIEILNSVVDPWNQGTAALGTYGDSLELATSGYVAQLKLIEDELTNIQNQADATARSLIAMANAQSSQIINSGTSSKPSSSGKTTTPASKPSTTTSGKPSVGQMVTVKTSATNWSRDGGNGTRIASFVKGSSYTVKQVSGNEVLIGTSNGYTGWINKKDLVGYAKGTTGVKKSGHAVIDENGLEEIVMHTKGGKVAYLTKGTSVLPHDISENLMKLGSVDYRALLDRNKPKVGAPYVVNNDIELNLNVGEVIHVEHMDNDSLPEIQDAIQKQLDSYIKRMNNGVRKYAR
nr:MAG TPA: minor tail protein [Caudoviricetes sp.]